LQIFDCDCEHSSAKFSKNSVKIEACKGAASSEDQVPARFSHALDSEALVKALHSVLHRKDIRFKHRLTVGFVSQNGDNCVSDRHLGVDLFDPLHHLVDLVLACRVIYQYKGIFVAKVCFILPRKLLNCVLLKNY
jgi:hypothetical protein